jgi:hypothetical protein
MRRSSRQSRQRYDAGKQLAEESPSSESEHSNDEGLGDDPPLPDPADRSFPASAYTSSALDHLIGRPMHRGDDEGRPAARRVKRPPEDNEEGEEEEGEENVRRSKAARLRRGRAATRGRTWEDDEADADENGSGKHRGRALSSSQQASARYDSDDGESMGMSPSRFSSGGGGDPQGPGRARVRLSKCWLCTFASSKMAKQIAAFVSANAGNMDPTIMADQIKHEVLKEVSSSSIASFSGRT